MSDSALESNWPPTLLTRVGFEEMKKMESLRSARTHESYIPCFDEQLLIATAKCCSTLQYIRFTIPQERQGMWRASDVSACLVGSDAFKSRVLNIVQIERYDWWFHLAVLRDGY